jgi:hypothetical protein
MVREGPAQRPPYPAEKARGGEIILRHRWQRGLFIAGLVVPLIVLMLLYAIAT